MTFKLLFLDFTHKTNQLFYPLSIQHYTKHNPQSCSVSQLIPDLCEPEAMVFAHWRCASGRHWAVLPLAPNTAAAVISISVVMVM